MKPIRSALSFVLFVSPLLHAESVSVATATQVPNVQLTLTLSPATTLPGIPVTVRILVTNDSSKRVELPAHIVMRATKENGETFAVLGPKQPQIAVVSLGERFVAPRSSTLLEVAVQGASIQPLSWFDDPRLNMPGRFRLQAVLGTFPDEFPELPEWAVRSNPAMLEIVTPEGVDLEIWKEMLAIGNGRWGPAYIATLGRDFARRVVMEMPQSTYAGWFAACGPWEPAHESAVLLRGWLAQATPDEFTEWREYRLAVLEEDAARQWTQIPREEVRAHVRNSRLLFAKLTRSKNEKIARMAKETLAASGELDELAEYGERRE